MKIVLVDDHPMLLDSLALLLQNHFGDALTLLHAIDGCSALKYARDHADLNLIVLDLDLPDMHGFQVIQQLKKTNADIPILAISGSVTPQLINQSLALGTAGFIPKTLTGQETLSAIDLVLDGGYYIPTAALSDTSASSPCVTPTLTNRQLDVLQLIRKGLSNDEIAIVLKISIPTVKSHTHSIFISLEVKNRTEAVNEALLLHLL